MGAKRKGLWHLVKEVIDWDVLHEARSSVRLTRDCQVGKVVVRQPAGFTRAAHVRHSNLARAVITLPLSADYRSYIICGK